MGDELKSMTQSENEKISAYVASLRLITEKFKYPISFEKMLPLVYRGLILEYRRFAST